jgi:D-beta-D-heptose 7-phosphate kinase/D-beta-D-heptose 1-phosphate adenosyltransferase
MVLSRYNCAPEILIQATRQFRKKRIMVIGDLMLDRFIWGAVSRISPEAPVPVVEVRKETTCLGGAANVVANISSLGGNPVPLGVLGDDIEGESLRAEFKALGISAGGLVVDRGRATSVKTRIIAHHQQVCRADREDRSPLSPESHDRILKVFRSRFESADAIVISDYAKGLISKALLGEILPLAKSRGKVVCIDPKSSDLSIYRPATVITPNTHEVERAAGLAIHNRDGLLRAGHKLLRQTGIPYLLVTRGEEGMTLFGGGKPATHIPTVAREVFDVTGAGDTVISVLALGLVSGLSMLEAAVLANIAAGIVVGKLGTASVAPEELIARIKSQEISG